MSASTQAIAADPVKQTVQVAVGVVIDALGRVLVALRPEGAHQGGLWEFPGGKCEAGEGVETALARELLEEVGITVLRQEPFCVIRHDYGDKEVLLDVRRVHEFAGTAGGKEGQPIRWAELTSLEPGQFPAANRSIIRRLQLPSGMAITGAAESEQDFLDRFTRLLAAAPAIIQLRAPELSSQAYLERAARCLPLCRRTGTRLLLNTEPMTGARLRSDGLHVSARFLLGLEHRPIGEDRLFGASCHTLEELRHAELLGADYAFLSPVLSTASHPEQTPLGWESFRRLAASVNLPVYALGGLGPDDVVVARTHGGVGVAGISAYWPTSR